MRKRRKFERRRKKRGEKGIKKDKRKLRLKVKNKNPKGGGRGGVERQHIKTYKKNQRHLYRIEARDEAMA
jgi:hypothetical protein